MDVHSLKAINRESVKVLPCVSLRTSRTKGSGIRVVTFMHQLYDGPSYEYTETLGADIGSPRNG